MKVYLLEPERINPAVTLHQRSCFDGLAASAAIDERRRHERVADVDGAGLILAAIQGEGFGPHFRQLRKHRIFKDHHRKILCYCPDELAYATLPVGFTRATPYWAARGWVCGGHYFSTHLHRHRFDPALPAAERDFLFTFVGSSSTHEVRRMLLELRHERALLQDVTPKNGGKEWHELDAATVERLYFQFEQGLNRGKFALCPRGMSVASIRLFEAMEAGCVPVVIADGLVLPPGPDWETFCVQVPEAEIASIPARLEAMEGEFESRGALARAAWERYFSPSMTFDSVVEWGSNLFDTLTPRRRALLQWQARLGEYLIARNLRLHCRPTVRKVRARLQGAWKTPGRPFTV